MAQYKGVLQVWLALCFFALLAESCLHGKCPDNFERVGGRCVKILTDKMIGDEAYDECGKLGADLAVVDTYDYSVKLGLFLIDKHNGTCYSYWTAGHRDGTTGNFYWKRYTASTDKTKLEFPAWLDVQLSNNNKNEDCLELAQKNGKVRLNDVPCNGLKIASLALKLCSICQTVMTLY